MLPDSAPSRHPPKVGLGARVTTALTLDGGSDHPSASLPSCVGRPLAAIAITERAPVAGMFKLLIADDEGKTTVVPLVRDEVTIGRKEGNTIRLTERNVSRKHAKLRRVNGVFFVSDLKSFNGVRVNGRRIESETELKSGDQLVIGDYQLTLQFEGTDQIDTGPTTTAPMAAPDAAEGPTALVAAPPVEAGPPARLVMVSPPAPGAEFALTRPRLRIGRSEELEIWVNHRSISREHAEIAIDHGTVMIRDLGSANGVRINGVDTKQGALKPGDVLELGQVRFRMVGAGEHFHFDAERTIQMDAVVGPAPPNRTPLFIAAGIVAVALVAGAMVAVSGGGSATPTVTQIETTQTLAMTGGPSPAVAEPPAPLAVSDAQIAQAVSACQLALNSGNFTDAILRADDALRLRPGDPQATACRDAATQARAEDEVFLAGQSALRQADLARAVELFGQLPEGSQYRNRPEIQQATTDYARALLTQARGAADPVEARGIAERILALGAIDPTVRREAQLLQRRTPGAPAAPVVRVERSDRSPRGERPSPTAGRPAAGGSGPAAAAVSPQPASSGAGDPPSPEEEARVCLANGDNACIIRLLGGGRARTARQLAMLANAQRQLTGVPSACGTITQLLERFPASREATLLRPVHVSNCQRP
jgi:pSer/pThr/pTyr-binding forkhead associated (FHA) protein